MPKITKEQKEKFYNLYKQGYRAGIISKTTGIANSFVKRIIHSFDSGDFSWLESGFRHYTKAVPEEEKVRIVQEIISTDLRLPEAVSKYNFPESVLAQWKRNYTEYGVCTRRKGRPRKENPDGKGCIEDKRAREREEIASRRNHYLQNILPGLRRERDRSAKKNILRTVGECRRLGIPLGRCLEVLELSPSTYHFWKRHESDERTADVKLAEAIRLAQEQNNWAYGAKRMAKLLVAEGFAEKLNHKRVERVMGEYDLHARARKRRYPRNYYLALKENPAELPGNILARDFTADEPMQKLVTDITYLPTDEGWIYMAAVLDLWNREIVSYRIDRHMSLGMVKDVVSRLKGRGIGKNTLIHSDMGWTYTHASYVNHLKELGVSQSMSRKGNCWDNACMENFFGHLKSETFKQDRKKKSYTFEEMNRLVEDYIDWYNNYRIQKKLGYLSPVDYRKMVT